MAVFLYVSKTVASLQFDLETVGSVTLEPTIQKQMVSNRLPDGKLRVIIFSLSQVEFIGKFASVDSAVTLISNVVGADKDGIATGALVTTAASPSKPQSVNIEIK
jgi:hypothetical protein